MFFANFSKNQRQKTPLEYEIDGGYQQHQIENVNDNGEPALDLEYAMALVNPIEVELYQVGDDVEGGWTDNLLDAIDGSYCTFEGGDVPGEDGIYPDNASGGYNHSENCGTYPATKVISVSYAENEHGAPFKYAVRQCQEFAKLGLMGVSVLFSSGDLYGRPLSYFHFPVLTRL